MASKHHAKIEERDGTYSVRNTSEGCSDRFKASGSERGWWRDLAWVGSWSGEAKRDKDK